MLLRNYKEVGPVKIEKPRYDSSTSESDRAAPKLGQWR